MICYHFRLGPFFSFYMLKSYHVVLFFLSTSFEESIKKMIQKSDPNGHFVEALTNKVTLPKFGI